MKVIQGGANVDAFVNAVTGVSPAMGRVMLIKRIACSYDWSSAAVPAPGVTSALFVNLNTQQDIDGDDPALQHNGTIYYHAMVDTFGGDGATAAEAPGRATFANGMPAYVEFDDPIPVSDDEISLYVYSTGQTGARTVILKIWYRVETVTLAEALTILESYR
jgi:hypothetical protein